MATRAPLTHSESYEFNVHVASNISNNRGVHCTLYIVRMPTTIKKKPYTTHSSDTNYCLKMFSMGLCRQFIWYARDAHMWQIANIHAYIVKCLLQQMIERGTTRIVYDSIKTEPSFLYIYLHLCIVVTVYRIPTIHRSV